MMYNTTDSSLAAQEVTWQVAFFALVPLALGAMTQPVGRVFDTPSELALWLQSLPVACVGDILYFLFRVAIDYSLEPCWSWRHFKTELAHCFRDTNWSEDPPEFERATLCRWMLILLGSIPCQTIKLMAMKGIPLTQTLAVIYFVAVVFGEVLNIRAEKSLRITGPSSRQTPPSETRTKWLELYREILDFLQVCAALLFMLELLTILLRGQQISRNDFDISRNVFIFTSLMGSTPFVFTGFRVDFRIISEFSYGFNSAITFSAGSFTVLMIFYVSEFHPLWGILAIFSWFPTLGLGYIIGRLTWAGLGYLEQSRVGHILGIPRTDAEKIGLLFFLFYVPFAVMCYAYLFEGTGMVNPSWAGIFG